jgi:hypothetical protein
MNIEQCRNVDLTGESRKIQRSICFRANSSTANLTSILPILNSTIRCEKPAASRLNHEFFSCKMQMKAKYLTENSLLAYLLFSGHKFSLVVLSGIYLIENIPFKDAET